MFNISLLLTSITVLGTRIKYSQICTSKNVCHRPILQHAQCAPVTTHKTEIKWSQIDITYSLKYQKLRLPQVCATFGPSDVHFPNMKANYDMISIRCYETFTKVTFCLW